VAPATSKKTATGETSEETVAETPKKTTRTKKTAATSKPAKKAPAKKRAAAKTQEDAKSDAEDSVETTAEAMPEEKPKRARKTTTKRKTGGRKKKTDEDEFDLDLDDELDPENVDGEEHEDADEDEEAVAKIREQVGSDEVILGLSGGVDSSVAAALIHRAIGDQLTCVFVDHGLLRLNEGKMVMDMFARNLGVKVIHVDAEEQFMAKLAGVTDPEKKRKITDENGNTKTENFKHGYLGKKPPVYLHGHAYIKSIIMARFLAVDFSINSFGSLSQRILKV